jgi:hypothetical protein
MQKFKMYLSLKENRNLEEEKNGIICTSKIRPCLSPVVPEGSD